MTTIVVVRRGRKAAIAADSLTTFGTTRLAPAYDRNPHKIITYADSYIGVAGSAAHQLVLENLLGRNPDLALHGKEAIYESFRRLHPLLKEEAFLNPKEEEDDPYESSQMTVMIANPSGIFAVYSMREVFEFDRFWAIGSGRDFALGAMFVAYAGTKGPEQVAKVGVEAGAEYDTGSSLPMSLHTVTIGE
jgi:ATP-dependent protease HslVU (ClpYQ) peptidase subunit